MHSLHDDHDDHDDDFDDHDVPRLWCELLDEHVRMARRGNRGRARVESCVRPVQRQRHVPVLRSVVAPRVRQRTADR